MKALFKTQDPAHPYAFEFNGTEITNPIISECGRFPVSPEYYGFEFASTGGGFTAHAQDFLLDGRVVSMMIVNAETNKMVDENTITAGIEILDEDGMPVENDRQTSHWQVNR